MRVIRFLLVGVTLGLASLLVWYVSPHLPEFSRQAHVTYNDREVVFLVINLTQGGYDLTLKHAPGAPQTVRSWREQSQGELVVNAAYFTEDMTPSGFFKVAPMPSAIPWPDETQQADPVGYTFLVTFVDGQMDLAYLPDAPQTEPIGDALLSFPTLVVDGEANVSKDSEMHAARTMLAEDAEGNDYLIITERGSLSLYEAAQWLAEQPEDFTIAGNLDGGPSTGISLENGSFDVELSSSKVPSAIIGNR